MAQAQRFRIQIGDVLLDLESARPKPHPGAVLSSLKATPSSTDSLAIRSGREAVDAAASAMGPQGLLVFAEQLRCFAEAAAYEAAARLEERAQVELAAELDEVAASSEGMARSVAAGRLAADAPEQAAVQEIALVKGIARQSAARELTRARLVSREVPAVLDALASGETGPIHTRNTVDLAAKIVPAEVPAPVSDDPASLEEHHRALRAAKDECRARRRGFCNDMLAHTPGKTPGQLDRYGKRRLERELDEPFSARHRRAWADRFVAVDPDDDGMCYLTAYIPTAAAEAIDRRLAEYAAVQTSPESRTRPGLPGVTDAPTPDGGEPGGAAAETRTIRQIRADAFVDVLLSGPEAVGLSNVKPAITVTVPATLIGALEAAAADGPEDARATRLTGQAELPTRIAGGLPDLGGGLAEAERFGVFGHDELADLLPQASTWTRVVTDPWTGAITEFDADVYRPPATLRRALALRDRTCRVPGCGRRASACEPDHVVEHRHGGATRLENLVSLCKRCHRLKSWGLLTFDLQPDGTLDVESFWGTRRVTLPDAPWTAAPARAVRQVATMFRARTIKIDTGEDGLDLYRHGPGLWLQTLPGSRDTPGTRDRECGRTLNEELERLSAHMERSIVEYIRPCPF
ncbi:hypothetical protein BJH93_03065 [Kocuria polaris]|nr:hypothetical protein [Kocuria polaris]